MPGEQQTAVSFAQWLREKAKFSHARAVTLEQFSDQLDEVSELRHDAAIARALADLVQKAEQIDDGDPDTAHMRAMNIVIDLQAGFSLPASPSTTAGAK